MTSRKGAPAALVASAAASAGLLAAPPALTASQDEAREAIEVEARRANIDAGAGTSVYQGDAVLTSGEMRITGDRLEIHTDDDRQLSHIVVDGSPATYRDRPEGQPNPVKGESARLEYYAEQPERVRLDGNAKLWQGDSRVTAETIKINLQTQAMQAQGEEGDRARAVLQPGRRGEP